MAIERAIDLGLYHCRRGASGEPEVVTSHPQTQILNDRYQRRLAPRRGAASYIAQSTSVYAHKGGAGEAKVIGDEPATPTTIRVRQWNLLSQGEDTLRAGVSSGDTSIERPNIVGLVVKPIGKPSV
jgi:hypothetical protein